MNAIELLDLAKTYKQRRKGDVEALKGISFHVEPGEVFGFLGPNGAGKSTTIKILTGQIKASAGQAMISGHPAVLPSARSNVGYLPENPALYDFMTAREYLAMVGAVHRMTGAKIHERTEQVLQLLNLESAARRPIRGFSKGMVQRLGLAQAMLHDPEVYILDEPMSGLDPIGRSLVKDIILDLKARGKTVFFSTHITSDVEAVCDRIAVLCQGELVALDKVSDILREGIVAYRVSYKLGDAQAIEQVAPAALSEQLGAFTARDAEILSVEPVQKGLEDFFLSAIGRKS